MTVDIELLLGLVDLLHNDITDRRHIQLADGIKALAAENGRLKGLVNMAKAYFTYDPKNTIEALRREDDIRRWLARAEGEKS